MAEHQSRPGSTRTRDWYHVDAGHIEVIFRWYPSDMVRPVLNPVTGEFVPGLGDYEAGNQEIYGFYNHKSRADLVPFRKLTTDLIEEGYPMFTINRYSVPAICLCGNPNGHLDERFAFEWQRWTT